MENKDEIVMVKMTREQRERLADLLTPVGRDRWSPMSWINGAECLRRECSVAGVMPGSMK